MREICLHFSLHSVTKTFIKDVGYITFIVTSVSNKRSYFWEGLQPNVFKKNVSI